MRFNYLYVMIFFVATFFLTWLIIPYEYDLINIYKNSDDYAQASQLVRSLSSTTADGKDRADLEIAKLKISYGEFDEAMELLDIAFKKDPKNADIARAYLNLGKQSFNRDALIKGYRGLIRLEPENTQYLKQLIHLHRFDDAPDVSIPLLQRLIKLAPKERFAWEELTYIHLHRNNTDAAIALMYEFIERYPRDAPMLELLIDTLNLMDRKKEALALHRRLFLRVKSSIDSLIVYVKMLNENKEYTEAQEIYKELLTRSEGLSRLLNLGEYYLFNNNNDTHRVFAYLYSRYPKTQRVVDSYLRSLLFIKNDNLAINIFKNFYNSKGKFNDYYEGLTSLYYFEEGQENPYFDRISKINLSTPTLESRILLSYFYERKKLYDFSAKQGWYLVQSQPKNKEYWELYIRQLENGSLKYELKTALVEYVSIFPDDISYKFKLARTYDWVQEHEPALPILEELVKNDKKNLEYKYYLGNVYLALKKFEEAADQYKELVNEGYKDYDFTDSYIYAIENIKSPFLAKRHGLILKNKDSEENKDGSEKVMFLMAGIYKNLGDKLEETKLYKGLMKVAKTETTWSKLGDVWMDSKDFDQAKDAFSKVLETDPRNLKGLLGMSKSLFHKGSIQSSNYLDQAAKVKTDNPSDFFEIASQYNDIKAKDKAKDFYKKFLDKTRTGPKTDSPYARERALAYAMLGQYRQSHKILAEVQEKEPYNRGVVNEQANYYIEEKNYSAAIDIILTFNAFLEKNGIPDTAGLSQRKFSDDMLMQSYLAQKEHKKALEIIQKLKPSSPNSDDLTEAEIEIYTALGDWDKALAVIDELKSQKISMSKREYLLEKELGILEYYGIEWGNHANFFAFGSEFSFLNTLFYRWFYGTRTHLTFDFNRGFYEDPVAKNNPNFSTWINSLSATLSHYKSNALRGSTELSYTLTPYNTLSSSTHILYQPLDKLILNFYADFNKPWLSPIDSITFKGVYDNLSVAAFFRLVKSWYFRLETAAKTYRSFISTYFGESTSYAAYLGTDIIDRTYGSKKALRHLSIEVGYQEGETQQTTSSVNLLDIASTTKMLSLGIFSHWIFSEKSNMDLSILLAQDSARGLSFGSIYGIEAVYRLQLKDNINFFAQGAFFAESLNSGQTGESFRTQVGLNIKF